MRPWKLIVGAVAALALAGGFATWYFVFRDTSPDAVNIDRASQSITTADPRRVTTTSGGSGLSGTWKVDSSIGSFNDFTDSFVGYRVKEELAGIGAKTTTGRTPDVTGSLTINGTTTSNAGFTADLTTLKSDESFRDNALGDQAIETATFPTAKFKLTTPIDVGSVSPGQTVHVQAVGTLTLHGVTREITMPLDAKLQSNVIVVTGQLDVVFADYKIQQPHSFKVLSVESHGILEVQLFFTKA